MSSSTIWSAGRYESVAEHIAPIAIEVVTAADRRAGVRNADLVDLACGTGSAALAAVARGARVTAVDVTPELIEIAAAKAADAPIDWVIADASATGLPDQAFDVAVSNMGIIFVEPTAQVVELARLLKPAATLAFSSWVRSDDNPFFKPIIEVLGQPPAAGYSPDQWGDPDTVTARLSDGFDEVAIERGEHTWRYPSVDAALTFVIRESPMHVSVFDKLDAPTREALRAAFEAAFLARADERGAIAFDAPYVVVTARRR
jgi:SAM-dependent methyltransferase